MEEENKIAFYAPPVTKLGRRPPQALKPYDVIGVEEAPDLRTYWRILRARQWTVLGVLSIVFIVALIGTLKQEPMYRATALLEINRENPNLLTVQDLFQLENVSDTYLETQYKVLRSETLARRVIDHLHLDRLEEFNPSPAWWRIGNRAEGGQSSAEQRLSAVNPSPVDPNAVRNALKRFAEKLRVEPIRRSRLVQISFESRDPLRATQVVNTLTSDYIKQNLESRWEATQNASEWLSQQLEEMKAKLEKSEDELQAYAQAQGLLYLETEKGGAENMVNQRLRHLQEELTKAQAERFHRESLYGLVEAGDSGSLPGVRDDKLLEGLAAQLADLERQKAALTPTFSGDYPRVKQIQSQIDNLQETLVRERQRAAQRIVDDYRAAVRRERLVRRAFEEQRKQANEMAAKSVQYNILKREVETNRQLYEGLLGRLKEAGVSAGLKASNIRVVDAAEPPRQPAKPNLLLNLWLALVLGLGLGVAMAFLQHHLDNTLKSIADVEQSLRLPALGCIPAAESLNNRYGLYGLYGPSRVLARRGNGSSVKQDRQRLRIDSLAPQYLALAEAFRSLRTSLLLSTAERPPRSVLITSPEPGDGKTTVTINLAISLAQLGQRVLVMDADLRRPCVHRFFSLKSGLSLVHYLAGQQEWRAAVQSTGIPGLAALCCGPIPPAPAELLSSERMRTLLRETLDEYGFVLLDSPPLLHFADARILASLVEGVVLVVDSGATPRELAQRASVYTRTVGASLVGVVLNNLDVKAGGTYYKYYHGYYSSEPGGAEKPADRKS